LFSLVAGLITFHSLNSLKSFKLLKKLKQPRQYFTQTQR